MRYEALATDYDGTLASQGQVDRETVSALKRFVASGRKLLLVTGRELPDLNRVFPQLPLFARVVAENGALLYDPSTGSEELLCPPASRKFVSELQRRRVTLSVGRAIVATREPHLGEVLSALEQTGLQLRVALNKGSVMVLPQSVNKATGLQRALQDLGLSPAQVVGIGDAENDADFLASCGYAVAVANALPALKSRADLVTAGAHGAGVAELIEQLLTNGLPVPGRSSGGEPSRR
jgi:hydroxymethylpyrimidine pyrophosphatase-like HAD family hydrolase